MRRWFLSVGDELHKPPPSVALDPINFSMTSSIVPSVVKRFLAMTRCAGRSAFLSIALGFVCLAIFSPNGGILSPAAPPNQRNGPSDKVSGSKNIQRIQAEGRSSSLTLAVTSDRRAPVTAFLARRGAKYRL